MANDHGMAPGMILRNLELPICYLPGPPKEMEPMFLSYGYAKIHEKLESQERIESKVLRFYGIGEAELETVIEDLLIIKRIQQLLHLQLKGK